MRKLAFSTNAFKKRTLEEAVSTIRDAGYAGIEILADVPHAYPYSFDAAERSRLRALLDSSGLAVSNVNAFTLFAQGDTYHPSWIEADRAKRVAFTLEAIQLTKDIGGVCLSTEPGGPYEGDREPLMKLFAAGLKEVLPAAEAAGVQLLVEPEPRLLIERSSEMLALFDLVQSPALGVNFDIGHFHCVGERPAEAFRTLSPWVRHVHVEDIADRRHFHLIPGKGEIDFGEFFSAADEMGYTGFFTVELYTYEQTPEEACRIAMDFLARFAT